MSDSIWAFSRTSVQSWKISENSWQNWFFNLFVLCVVIFSEEKSKISSLFNGQDNCAWTRKQYLSSFKTTILFSHRKGLERLETTISEMNSGQFCGQSCLRICRHESCWKRQGLTSTSTRFNLLMYTFSLRKVRSSDAFLTIKATIKCRIPGERYVSISGP